MVGYQPNDTLTTQQKLIAGCLSGVVTRSITQPLDVVKLRVQLQKKPKNPNQVYKLKLFRTTRKILKEEGLHAFWYGHSLGQLHSILAVTCQFYVFELTTQFCANTELGQTHKNFTNFLCGWFGGCCSATLVNPLEVIRVRQMILSSQYKGLRNGARQVYKSGGFPAFYGGLSASLLQMGPSVGISFGVFSFAQPLILSYIHDCDTGNCHIAVGNHHRPENLLLASTISGSIAGFVSKTITYPFDLAKRRLQIATHKQKQGLKAPSTTANLFKCKSLAECLAQTLEREGFLGLFRGLKVTLYKAQVTSIVAFTSYELLCYAIREIQPHK